jgi:hypothetical protein
MRGVNFERLERQRDGISDAAIYEFKASFLAKVDTAIPTETYLPLSFISAIFWSYRNEFELIFNLASMEIT